MLWCGAKQPFRVHSLVPHSPFKQHCSPFCRLAPVCATSSGGVGVTLLIRPFSLSSTAGGRRRSYKSRVWRFKLLWLQSMIIIMIMVTHTLARARMHTHTHTHTHTHARTHARTQSRAHTHTSCLFNHSRALFWDSFTLRDIFAGISLQGHFYKIIFAGTDLQGQFYITETSIRGHLYRDIFAWTDLQRQLYTIGKSIQGQLYRNNVTVTTLQGHLCSCSCKKREGVFQQNRRLCGNKHCFSFFQQKVLQKSRSQA